MLPNSTCGGISLGPQVMGVHPTQLLWLQHEVASRQDLSNGVYVFQLLQVQQVVASHQDLSTGMHSTHLIHAVSARGGISPGTQQRGSVYPAAPAATHGGVLPGPHRVGGHPAQLELSQPQGHLTAVSQPLQCKARVATCMWSTCCIL